MTGGTITMPNNDGTMLYAFHKAEKLPKAYQAIIVSIIDQLCTLNVTKNNKKIIGIGSGKYDITADISDFDDEVAKLFGVVENE